ncbi:hypothetical protein AVEN_4509-1 [Araneus ventricosus]|uniref:Uncharacterized protein n=1 Tax=Araneus ventricosus TaxID=182803 RepID=A0A4Y2BL53_ARAVE|nr:hypothetical protein AVEN_4509-1 [Araneus ventricosus]
MLQSYFVLTLTNMKHHKVFLPDEEILEDYQIKSISSASRLIPVSPGFSSFPENYLEIYLPRSISTEASAERCTHWTQGRNSLLLDFDWSYIKDGSPLAHDA